MDIYHVHYPFKLYILNDIIESYFFSQRFFHLVHLSSLFPYHSFSLRLPFHLLFIYHVFIYLHLFFSHHISSSPIISLLPFLLILFCSRFSLFYAISGADRKNHPPCISQPNSRNVLRTFGFPVYAPFTTFLHRSRPPS